MTTIYRSSCYLCRRQLQEGLASKDAVLNELKYKADQTVVDQLSKRTQVMNDTASTISLTHKNFESRLIAVEKRIEYELTAAGDDRNQQLAKAVNLPADTSTSCKDPPGICKRAVGVLEAIVVL